MVLAVSRVSLQNSQEALKCGKRSFYLGHFGSLKVPVSIDAQRRRRALLSPSAGAVFLQTDPGAGADALFRRWRTFLRGPGAGAAFRLARIYACEH